MTIDMSQFYQVFFEEAGEHLANMESLLLALDVENPSNDELNAIFRAAHSIKGGSGTFGFTDMTEVTHILETLLDRLRKSELTLRPEMVDAFLAAGDILRGQLEHHQGGPEVDETEVRAVCDRLASLSSDTPQSRRLWLACMVSGEWAGDDAGRRNLADALSEVASVEIIHLPVAGDPRFTAWLTTTARDAEILDMLSFHAFPEDITLSASGPSGSDQVEEAYGFFDDVPQAEPEQEQAWGLFETT